MFINLTYVVRGKYSQNYIALLQINVCDYVENTLYVFPEYTALYYLGGQFPFFDLVFVCQQLNAKGCLVLATGSRRIKNNWQTMLCKGQINCQY